MCLLQSSFDHFNCQKRILIIFGRFHHMVYLMWRRSSASNELTPIKKLFCMNCSTHIQSNLHEIEFYGKDITYCFYIIDLFQRRKPFYKSVLTHHFMNDQIAKAPLRYG